jgi:hypothetical protein
MRPGVVWFDLGMDCSLYVHLLMEVCCWWRHWCVVGVSMGTTFSFSIMLLETPHARWCGFVWVRLCVCVFFFGGV